MVFGYVGAERFAGEIAERRGGRCATLLALGLVAISFSMTAQRPKLVSLAELKDQYRPLLVFARRPDDAQLEIQLRTLQEHAPEAQDRDLAVIGLPYGAPSPTSLQLSAAEAAAVRRRFGIAPTEFAVILLGKDGGEKLRSKKPIPIGKLDSTIDAMPMRQDEMRSKTHKP